MLRHSRRFGGPIGQLALAVNRGDARAAQQVLDTCADGSLAYHRSGRTEAIWRTALSSDQPSYHDYLHALHAGPQGDLATPSG